jgi:hypothetical protein
MADTKNLPLGTVFLSESGDTRYTVRGDTVRGNVPISVAVLHNDGIWHVTNPRGSFRADKINELVQAGRWTRKG